MSNNTPSFVTDGTVRPAHQELSDQSINQVLDDFRQWLQHIQLEPSEAVNGTASTADEQVDLHSLLGQFVAVRHEINLHTKSSRRQLEHNEATLEQLTQALDVLRQQQQRAPEEREQAIAAEVRPLLKALIQMHDALALANREVQRVEDTLEPALADLADLPGQYAVRQAKSAAPWAKWFRSAAAEEQARQFGDQTQQAVDRVRTLVTSITTGYGMSLQRVERALEQYDLEALEVVGEPFDPEFMEAVEVVVEPNRTRTEVIEEVRRGFVWKGEVFRFAQVRVAKPSSPE